LYRWGYFNDSDEFQVKSSFGNSNTGEYMCWYVFFCTHFLHSMGIRCFLFSNLIEYVKFFSGLYHAICFVIVVTDLSDEVGVVA
jgi:hypothetical protein